MSVKRLVQLDVDSTFIQQEAIELLAAKAGVLEEVSRITAAAMRGELDFAQSLVARVALLQGLSDDSFVQVQQEITVTDGAAELVTLLHQKGHCVSLVSGGFTNILQPIVDAMKIDFYRANTLEVFDGKLTGKVLGAVVDRASISSRVNTLIKSMQAIDEGKSLVIFFKVMIIWILDILTILVNFISPTKLQS